MMRRGFLNRLLSPLQSKILNYRRQDLVPVEDIGPSRKETLFAMTYWIKFTRLIASLPLVSCSRTFKEFKRLLRANFELNHRLQGLNGLLNQIFQKMATKCKSIVKETKLK